MGIGAATFLVLGASVSDRRRAIRDLRLALTHQDALLAERNSAHQRLITVLDQSPLAIGIAEAPSGQFLFVNGEMERLIGRRPEVSKFVDEASGGVEGFHLDGSPLTTDEWPMSKALLHGEVVRNQTVHLRRADGGEFDAMFNAAPVHDASGVVIAAVLIFWDVTAQRRADEALRIAYDTTAAANRAKSDFFAVMSHELRTPLNAISGYVELMALGQEGALSPQQKEYLDRINRNQRHLLSLIDDVLSFAKIEGGRLPLAMQTVRVSDAIGELEALIEPELLKRQLTFRREPVDESLTVRADPEKLRQVLLNFLANAMKFTEPGGSIDVGAERQGAQVQIRVSDTGIGIPATEITRVFEPFFQVERGMTRKYSGVGLGLAIARDLARAMRGDVTIESTPGKGTTVALLLPPA
jgi:signal transduction histidine kinase